MGAVVDTDSQTTHEFAAEPSADQCEYNGDEREYQGGVGGNSVATPPYPPASNKQQDDDNVSSTMP